MPDPEAPGDAGFSSGVFSPVLKRQPVPAKVDLHLPGLRQFSEEDLF